MGSDSKRIGHVLFCAVEQADDFRDAPDETETAAGRPQIASLAQRTTAGSAPSVTLYPLSSHQMVIKKDNPRPRELCGERQKFAAEYLAADTAYTKNLLKMKDAPEDLGSVGDRTMDGLRRFRDVALGACWNTPRSTVAEKLTEASA